MNEANNNQNSNEQAVNYTACCVPVPCYNCSSIEKDFYLIVKNERGQWLYDDVQNDIDEDDEIYEMEICGSCGSAL